MSLRGSDFRCELDADIDEMLRQMADHRKLHKHVLGEELLAKAIAGEFHAFKIMLDRLASSGILRRPADKGGK
jgi:hypothetical protein